MATYRLTAADRRALARMNAAKRNTARSSSYLAKSQTSGVASKSEDKEEAGVPTKVLHTVGDVGSDILFGVGKGLEGIVDFGAGLVGLVGGLFDDGFEDNIKSFIETDWVGKVATPVDSYFEHSYTNGSKVGEIIEGAASGIGQMLPSVAITIATAGVGGAVGLGAQAATKLGQAAGLAALGASAAGTGAEEAYKDGASFEQGLGYGALSGATEVATERLLPGPADAIFGKTIFKKGASEIAEQGTKRVMKNVAKEAINEGFEEMTSEATNPLRKTIYKGRDALEEYTKPEFYSGVLEAGATGALTSIGYSGTVGNIYNKAKGLNGDIDASISSIEKLNDNKARLQERGELNDASEAEIDAKIEQNLKQIEAVLGKSSASDRAKYIKNYELSGRFSEDGVLNAKAEDTSGLDKQYVSADARGQEERIKAALDKEGVTAFHGELSERGSEALKEVYKAHNALNKLGFAGKHVVIVNEMTDTNAYLDGDIIAIGKDMLENGEHIKKLVHETTHFTEGSKEWAQVADFVFGKDASKVKVNLAKEISAVLNGGYGITQADVDAVVEHIASGYETKLTAKQGELIEEVVANRMENMFGDSESIERICREKPSLAKRIWERIKALIDSLGQSSSEREEIKKLRETERLFRAALETGGQDYIRGEMENETVVHYSKNENSSIKQQLRDHLDEVNAMDPVANITYKVTSKQQAIKDAAIAFKKFGNQIDRQGYTIISLTEKELNESIKYEYTPAEWAAWQVVPYVLKRGKDISGHGNHKNRAYETRTIAAPAIINNKKGVVAVIVKSTNGTKYKSHRILMPDGSEYVFENQKDAEPTFAGVKGENHRQGPAISSASDTIISQNPEKSTPEVKKSKKISDAEYLSAVENGDMETAQRMVDEAAREWGGRDLITFDTLQYTFEPIINNESGEITGWERRHVLDADTVPDTSKPIPLYRSSDGGRNVWDKTDRGGMQVGIYLTDGRHIARGFATSREGRNAKIISVYAKAQNPFIIDAEGRNYTDIPIPSGAPSWLSGYDGTTDADNLPRKAFENGYDAVIIENVREGVGGGAFTDVVLRDSTQLKSFEPVTYDDEGKVIPLSQRFDSTKRDIRRSGKVGEPVTSINEEKMQVSEGDGYSEYDKPITIHDVEVLRSIGRKSINDFTSEEIKKAQKWAYKFYKELGVKSPFFRAWFGDWRAYENKTSVKIAKIPKSEIPNQPKSVKCEDVGWTIRISGHGKRNTRAHAGGRYLSVRGLNNIAGLIKNAIWFDSEIHEHHDNNAPNETVSFDHKLYALGKDEHGSIALYKITIEDIFQSYTEPNDYRFHNLRYLKEIEKVAEDISGSSDQADQPYTANSESSTTNYSISDLFEIVKTFDEKFKPKSVNEHLIDKETGLPKVFYLPENAAGDWSDGVTVYQNKHVNAQPVYISSYFEDGANPNFEIKDNGDVIVYDAGQVKSATDGGNIGTFDRGTKKIRYSRKSDTAYESKTDIPLGAIARGDQLLKSLDAGGELFSVPAILEEPEYKGEIDAEEELRKSEIKYLKGELKEAEYKRRLENAIVFKAKRLKTKELEKFFNATEYRREIFKDTIEQLGKIENQNNINSSGTRELIGELGKWYTEENPMLQNGEGNSLYDLEIADMIESVSKGNGKFTLDELKAIKDVLSYFRKFMESYNTIVRNGKRIDAKEQAKVYIDIMVENRKLKVSVPAKVFRRYHNVFGEPMSVCQFADMYQRGFFTESLEEIREGAIDAANTQMRFEKKFETFFKRNKKYLKEMLKRTVDMRGEKLSLNQAIGLYMALGRKDSHAGFAYSGFDLIVAETPKETVRAHDKNVSLKNREATIHFAGIDNAENMSEAEIEEAIKVFRDSLYKQFSEADKTFISIAEECYKECGEAKMKTDMLRTGYSRVISDYYYPLRRTGITYSVDERDFFSVMHNEVCDFAFTKESVKGAKQALLIQPMTDVLERHINQVSLYTGLAVAIDNYNILYNMNVTGDQRNVSSIKSMGAYAWEGGNEYFKKLLKDLKVAVSADDPAILKQLYGGYVSFALGANPKVWFTQWSSYIAAFVELDAVSLLKGGPLVGNLSGVSGKDVDKYSRLSELRNYDNSAAMAQAVVDRESKVINKPKTLGEVLMKPIGWTDRMVIETLFRAAQIKVAKEQGLKLGSEENKIEAGKILDRVILNTQQNALVTERSAAMRGSLLWRFFTTFSSDAMKLQARVVDAFCENSVLKKRRALIKADNTLSEAERAKRLKEIDNRLKASREKSTKVIATLFATSIYMYLIGMLFKLLYNKLDEEYEEKDAEGIAWDIGTTVFGNMVGGLPVIRDIVSRFTEGYEIDNYAYSSLNELLNSIETVYDTIINGKEEKAAVTIKNSINAIGQILGFPTRNIYNAVTGLIRRFSPTTGYKIDDFFYTQSYNADLKKAIENGDEDMIDTIIGLITEEKVGMIADTSVRKEMNKLSKAGYSVLPRSIGTSVTYDGEEIALSKKQQNRFKELYSAANEGAAKLVGSSLYNRADEEAKAKAIKFLYDTYYNLALQEVLDVDLESKNVLFAEAIDIEDLAIIYSIASGIEADKDRKGNVISGSRKAKIEKYVESLRMSAAEKYLVMGYLGYKCKNGADKVKAYVSRLNLTKDEKARLMEYCGYAA